MAGPKKVGPPRKDGPEKRPPSQRSGPPNTKTYDAPSQDNPSHKRERAQKAYRAKANAQLDVAANQRNARSRSKGGGPNPHATPKKK